MTKFFSKLDLTGLHNICIVNNQILNEELIHSLTVENVLSKYCYHSSLENIEFRRALFLFILKRFPIAENFEGISARRGESIDSTSSSFREQISLDSENNSSHASSVFNTERSRNKHLFSDQIFEEDLLAILYDIAINDIYCAMWLYSNKSIWEKLILSFKDNIDDDFQQAYKYIFLVLHLNKIAINYNDKNHPFYYENIRVLYKTALDNIDVECALIRIANVNELKEDKENFEAKKQEALHAIDNKNVTTSIFKYYALLIIYWFFNTNKLKELKAINKIFTVLTDIVSHKQYSSLDIKENKEEIKKRAKLAPLNLTHDKRDNLNRRTSLTPVCNACTTPKTPNSLLTNLDYDDASYSSSPTASEKGHNGHQSDSDSDKYDYDNSRYRIQMFATIEETADSISSEQVNEEHISQRRRSFSST